MELNFNKTEKAVGVFVISIAVLLLTSLVFIGRGKDWFRSYVPFFTTFNESYNLQENAAVKMYKADIGRVESITLDGEKVKVVIGILDEFRDRIRQGTIVTVESPTLIGSEYISIKPGKRDGALIEDNGFIKSEPKKTLAYILEQFRVEETGKMFIQAIQDFSAIISDLRSPKGPLFSTLDSLDNAMGNVNSITEDVKAGKGSLGSLLESRELIESILAKLDKVDPILKDINDASAQTPVVMDNANKLLTTVNESADESLKNLKQILADIAESTQKLKTIMENVKQGSYDVPDITGSVKQGIPEIRDAVENIDKTVQSLQKNILIKPNMPPEPEPESVDAGLRY